MTHKYLPTLLAHPVPNLARADPAMFPLAVGMPHGDVVTTSGAELIIAHHKDGMSKKDISKQVKTSVSTVKRVLGIYRLTQEAREPQQGGGRTSDVRWVFAGAGGAANLNLLDAIRTAGDDADLLEETYTSFLEQAQVSVAYSTVTKVLREDLDFRRKLVRFAATRALPLERSLPRSVRIPLRERHTPALPLRVCQPPSTARQPLPPSLTPRALFYMYCSYRHEHQSAMICCAEFGPTRRGCGTRGLIWSASTKRAPLR